MNGRRLLAYGCAALLPLGTLTTPAGHAAEQASQVAPVYALDFVGTAATGYSLNSAGHVVGRSYTDPGCGSFCLPPQQNVVWQGGERIVLPLVTGFDSNSQSARFINDQGLIAGVTGEAGTNTQVAIWRPGSAPGDYSAIYLGTLTGMSHATVAGLDESGRIVGWSSTGGAIPTASAPYMWSDATGMVNLAAEGYPNEIPAAMSPAGAVVTSRSWYRLGDPDGAVALPALPSGFTGAGSNGSAINDSGDQAHFLVSISTQNLAYPFRLANGGGWQQISSAGSGQLSRYAMGSINPAQDVTFTVLGSGAVAAGPTGIGQSLSNLISPAYAGATVTFAGPMNSAGQILAQVMIGRSARLVKMTPASACSSDCLVSSSLLMTAQFIEDPAFPGSCFQNGRMYNRSTVTVTMTSESGSPLGNVLVSGRFLDDYWTNHPVSATTNSAGVATWTYQGLCGVGAIAFLVDDAQSGTRRFDRTRGVLANHVIPTTTPPPTNQPPVPVATVSCSAGKVCVFDGSASHDPDGTIVAYRWKGRGGVILSNSPSFSTVFPKQGKNWVTLRVTDNGGLRAETRISFTVLR